MAIKSAHGVEVKFTPTGGSATTFNVTNVQISETADVVDSSHLGLAQSARKTFITGLLDAEVTFDYISDELIDAGEQGALEIGTNTDAPFTYNATDATCTSGSLGGTVGDLVKGSATFKVATVSSS